MPVININVASIQARSNFERVQRDMDQSIASLSSDKRINSTQDEALETTALTRATILQQTATSMIAQANANKNSILLLMQG